MPSEALKLRRVLAHQGVRFLIIGGLNTAAGYGIFVLLYLMLRDYLHYLAIGVIAHFCAVCFSFLTHSTWVFTETGRSLDAFIRYNLATLAPLVFGAAGMVVIVEWLKISPIVAQAIVTATSVALLFMLHKHYSFRARRSVGRPRH